MHKGFFRTATILGLLSVALGAFAAHGLKGLVANKVIDTFELAVRYQFLHVFALLITALVYKEIPRRIIAVAGWLFISGIILFCGSLYILAYSQALVKPGFGWVGPVTPIGGLCFIGGWLLLLIASFKKS